MSQLDDLRTKLAYLEQSDANAAAAEEVRAEIAAEEGDKPAKKPRRP